MAANDPSFRINEESYDALLNCQLERNIKAKQRRHRNIYDGYSSTKFLREEIQPKMTRIDTVRSASGDADRHCRQGHNQANTSRAGPKRRFSPLLVSECIQQQTLHPPRVTTWKDNECDKVSNINETKKRPRCSFGQIETTVTSEAVIELRIEGKTTTGIISEIRTKSSRLGEEESSVLFKGIQELPTSFTDFEDENEMEESLLLRNSLEDLVLSKGSSWKRIRIHECSPMILAILLASPHCQKFEEIHIVGRCDDRSQSSSIQAESPPDSKVQSLPSTSSLIVSLLRKTARIRELVLKNCNLENYDLMCIMDIVCSHPNHPKSLERLDLRFNNFSPNAIQSILADHLRSSLHSLKTLKLRQGIRSVVHRNIRNAVVQSLRCNQVVLESIDVFDWDKSVQYLLDINRAKRRFIFCNNDRFPRTLWPLLLENALVDNEEDDYKMLTRRTRYPSSLLGPTARPRYISGTRRQASVVYHMFRNGGPMLLQQHHSSKQPTGLE